MFGLSTFAGASFGATNPSDSQVVFSTIGAITSSLGSTATTAAATVISVNVGNIVSSLGTHSLVVSPTAAISGLSITSATVDSITPFTWTSISDNVDESWSAVTTTGSSESWTEVEEDSTDETTTWTDA